MLVMRSCQRVGFKTVQGTRRQILHQHLTKGRETREGCQVTASTHVVGRLLEISICPFFNNHQIALPSIEGTTRFIDHLDGKLLSCLFNHSLMIFPTYTDSFECEEHWQRLPEPMTKKRKGYSLFGRFVVVKEID